MLDPEEEKKVEEIANKISLGISSALVFALYSVALFSLQYFGFKWMYRPLLSWEILNIPLYIPLFSANALGFSYFLVRESFFINEEDEDKKGAGE